MTDNYDKKLAFLCDMGYSEGQLNWFGRNSDRIDECCEKHGYFKKDKVRENIQNDILELSLKEAIANGGLWYDDIEGCLWFRQMKIGKIPKHKLYKSDVKE